jgi:tRNA modification GTPase
LREQISRLLLSQTSSTQDTLLTRARQKQEVDLALSALHEALHASDDTLMAAELRMAGAALDRLLGKTLGEDVLDLIFSRFCIGK